MSGSVSKRTRKLCHQGEKKKSRVIPLENQQVGKIDSCDDSAREDGMTMFGVYVRDRKDERQIPSLFFFDVFLCFFSPPWIERQATGAARGPGPKALKNVIDQPRPGPGRARYRIGAVVDLEIKSDSVKFTRCRKAGY